MSAAMPDTIHTAIREGRIDDALAASRRAGAAGQLDVMALATLVVHGTEEERLRYQSGLLVAEALLSIREQPGSHERWERLFVAFAARAELAAAWRGLALASDARLAPAEAWATLVALMLENGEAELALGAARDGAGRSDSAPALHAMVALLATEAGDLVGAERAIEIAHALDPLDPLAWVARARFSWACGDAVAADAAAHRAIELGASAGELHDLLRAGRVLDLLRAAAGGS